MYFTYNPEIFTLQGMDGQLGMKGEKGVAGIAGPRVS